MLKRVESGPRLRVVGFLAALGLLSACGTPAGPAGPAHHEHLHFVQIQGPDLLIDGCRVHDGDSVFSVRADTLPLAADQSPVAVSATSTNPLAFRPAAAGYWNSGSVLFPGLPLNLNTGTTPRVPVLIDKGTNYPDTDDYLADMALAFPVHRENESFTDESLQGLLPNVAQINDDHISTIVQGTDEDDCTLEEAIRFLDNPLGNGPTAEKAARWQLPIGGVPTQPRAGGSEVSGVDVAGFPMSPLKFRFDELFTQAGGGTYAIRKDLATNQPIESLNHVLAVVISAVANRGSQWPAAAGDGTGDLGTLKMGSRLRLNTVKTAALLADPAISAGTKVLVRTMRNYGLMIHDSSGPGAFGIVSEPDTRWAAAPGGVPGLPEGTDIGLGDFELLDQSCLQVPDAPSFEFYLADLATC